MSFSSYGKTYIAYVNEALSLQSNCAIISEGSQHNSRIAQKKAF